MLTSVPLSSLLSSTDNTQDHCTLGNEDLEPASLRFHFHDLEQLPGIGLLSVRVMSGGLDYFHSDIQISSVPRGPDKSSL